MLALALSVNPVPQRSGNAARRCSSSRSRASLAVVPLLLAVLLIVACRCVRRRRGVRRDRHVSARQIAALKTSSARSLRAAPCARRYRRRRRAPPCGGRVPGASGRTSPARSIRVRKLADRDRPRHRRADRRAASQPRRGVARVQRRGQSPGRRGRRARHRPLGEAVAETLPHPSSRAGIRGGVHRAVRGHGVRRVDGRASTGACCMRSPGAAPRWAVSSRTGAATSTWPDRRKATSRAAIRGSAWQAAFTSAAAGAVHYFVAETRGIAERCARDPRFAAPPTTTPRPRCGRRAGARHAGRRRSMVGAAVVGGDAAAARHDAPVERSALPRLHDEAHAAGDAAGTMLRRNRIFVGGTPVAVGAPSTSRSTPRCRRWRSSPPPATPAARTCAARSASRRKEDGGHPVGHRLLEEALVRMAAIAVVDVETGRIEALAGALSPCTREEYDGPGRRSGATSGCRIRSATGRTRCSMRRSSTTRCRPRRSSRSWRRLS